MSEPKVFEHAFRVAPDDMNRMGHVNNYAQDAALTKDYQVPFKFTGKLNKVTVEQM